MLALLSFAFAADVSIHDSLATGSAATTVYGGTFTGSGWRVDDSNSRLFYDFGRQVDRGTVSFTTSGITLDTLTGDNNEFIQMFDSGDKWSCNHAITFRVYGSDDGTSQGDTKLKAWDNVSGIAQEARGGVQTWDGLPHTWTVAWDQSSATLDRDGVRLVTLDVTGEDLTVGTLWLPLNTWDYGYSHPIGSVYSNLSVEAWEPGGSSGGDTGNVEPTDGGRAPIQDVGASEGYGSAVYDAEEDLPLEGTIEGSYLLFDLSDLSGSVTAATLTLHAQSDSHAEGDGGTVYAVADTSWTEDTLTWANRPALGAGLASFGAISPDSSVTVDVTAGTHAGGLVAFAIANGGGNGAHFWSREGSNPPSLTVTVVDDGGSGGDTDNGSGGDTDNGSGSDDTGNGWGGRPSNDGSGASSGPPDGAPADGGCGCDASDSILGQALVAAGLLLAAARRR